ncbi:MAG: Fe(2+)-trafficking protein [Phycisphaerae bacterium]
MTTDERIAQFQNVIASNPNDELAQFSLGSALVEARRFGEAGPCFQRVLALNANYSPAYALLGRCQIETGHRDFAVQTLTNGYLVAHKRGDLKPRNEMGELLRSLGANVPNPEAATRPAPGAAAGGASGDFACSRCGGGTRMTERPFKGPLGEKILATVCQSCWGEWIRMGTKVINELRLPMFDPKAQEVYDQHMREFLNVGE